MLPSFPESNTTANTVSYAYLDADTLDVIVDLMDGDTELIIDLVDTLTETTPELLDELVEGVKQSDPEKIRESAHSLKSSNAQLGAFTFADLCLQMENLGKTDELENADRVLELIQEEFERVNQALESWKQRIQEES